MKYCPTCSQVYEDETAKFCLKDGTPLASKPSSPQLSINTFPEGSPTFGSGAVPRNQNSKKFDSFVTLDQSTSPNLQERASASEARNEDPQEPDTATPRRQKAEGTRLVFNLSEIGPPTEKTPAKPSTKPRSRSRLMRWVVLLLGVVGVAIVIVAAGIFFWWRHYKTTPPYSLALLVDAVHGNDNATIDRIVAMDKITDSFTSQLTQSVSSQYTSASDSVRKQAELPLSGLSPTIKQMVREEVEKDLKEEAAPSTGRPFLLIALAMPYKVDIRQTGEMATVNARTHPVEFTMQRNSDDLWTVIAMKDDALTSRIQSQIAKDLPAINGEKKPSVATEQKSGSARNKNPNQGAQAKKKGRAKQNDGLRIDLPRIPWPE